MHIKAVLIAGVFSALVAALVVGPEPESPTVTKRYTDRVTPTLLYPDQEFALNFGRSFRDVDEVLSVFLARAGPDEDPCDCHEPQQ